MIWVGNTERYRRLIRGRPASNVQNHPDIRKLKVSRRVAVPQAKNASAEDLFVVASRSLDVGNGEKMRDADPLSGASRSSSVRFVRCSLMTPFDAVLITARHSPRLTPPQTLKFNRSFDGSGFNPRYPILVSDFLTISLIPGKGLLTSPVEKKPLFRPLPAHTTAHFVSTLIEKTPGIGPFWRESENNSLAGQTRWRRGRDLNPKYPFRYGRSRLPSSVETG